jgi:hypothetical protein
VSGGRSGLTFVDGLGDERLFGALPAFAKLDTWRPWVAFFRAVDGLPMTAAEIETFRRHTQRSAPAPGGYREAVAIVGRQSGKSRIAATLAAFEAALAGRERGLYALLVAQDLRGAQRTLFGYATEPFDEVPTLRGLVDGRTAEALSLRNGVTLACYPCRPAAVRGLRACVVVVDELAFFTATDGRPTDVEMLRALRPTLATTGGKLLILSSPYAQAGALWDLHRKHYGRDDSPVLVWQASASEMNPTLPADYLARMEQDDPEAYRSEVLGEFRAGLSTLFEPECLDACVVLGRRELPPVADVAYVAFADPSGGSRDAFAVAIAHKGGDTVVVDCVRAWRPPFNPSGVVAEAAELLRTYGIKAVVGDRYAGEWPREAFRSHGVEYTLSDLDRSALYLELLPKVNARTVELPDVPELLRELRGLERRRGVSGRDRVDHGPGRHDDRANVVAGAVHVVTKQRRPPAIDADALAAVTRSLRRRNTFHDDFAHELEGDFESY